MSEVFITLFYYNFTLLLPCQYGRMMMMMIDNDDDDDDGDDDDDDDD